MPSHRILFSAAVLALAWPSFATTAPADSPRAKVDLLALIKTGQVRHHLNPSMTLHDPPERIWTFTPDGHLKISGKGFGYVRTIDDYRDYHLVIEHKFTGPTLGSREGKARDNGVLVHAHGPDGTYSNTWMASVEAQIIEGGTGDLLVLSPKLADGTVLQTSVRSSSGLDRDQEKIWTPGAALQTVTTGRINWEKRDVDWKDEAGFRGRADVESRVNEWTRMEVIAKGDTLQYFVNGVLVNEAFACQPAQGKICLQTEGAEMIVRRFELHPLGTFTEKWNPVSASGGTEVPVKPSRETAWSPEESRAAIALDGPYELQLVAAEPLVRDPVEMTWDAKGHCYVADMIDYPLGAGPGKAPLSRIQRLIDDDGDGRSDRAITFAAEMDHVQGLLPYRNGLIATTRTDILYLRDTTGDGVADIREPLIRGFNPSQSQLQVSSPRWGPDNRVYFNNGLDTKEIYPAAAPAQKQNFARSNLRWDPVSGALEPASGFGQYGGCFDDFGHHFFCSNRNPVMFAVMPHAAVVRNPLAGISQGAEDIAPSGSESRVYPRQLTHTTADAHAGTNTAACGLGVYRGDLMPELRNQIFVCDPTGQLITRYRIDPKGASFTATRVGDHTEFFRSRDEWCRPVNVTTGPDGALYVCDIYRRYIDHARYFPEEFAKTHDLRAGENEGRIWRIVPKGSKPRAIRSLPETREEIAKWLHHPNAWQVETARRILFETDAAEPAKPDLASNEFALLNWEGLSTMGMIDAISKAAGNQNARTRFAALIQLGRFGYNDDTVFDACLNALAPDYNDAWMHRAVLSSAGSQSGRILAALVNTPGFAETHSETKSAFVRSLAVCAAGPDTPGQLGIALHTLQLRKDELLWWKAALLQALDAKKLQADPDASRQAAILLAKADGVMTDAVAPLDQRLACISLLSQRPWDKAEPVVRKLLAAGQPKEIADAALALLKKFPADKTAPLLYELLPRLGPTARTEIVKLLTANGGTVRGFFERIARGEIPKAFVDAETRWRYLRPNQPLHDLAVELFGSPSSDRAAVIAQYAPALTTKGDALRGQQVFSTVCVACHRLQNAGADVGPSLADVRIKEKESLLHDILDPNRIVEARWMAYQIDTKDGRALSGLIAAETAAEVTLKTAGGFTEVLPRATIKEMKSLDLSLMPIGLEGAISQTQMADLLAFLKNE
jgi:putative membrane-bound dehydrogenase-like protein